MSRGARDLEMELAEAVHRARNDLQAVSAMLQLQATASADPAVSAALLEAATRVRALSSLNARLDSRAEGVATTIDGRAFVDGLARDLRSMHFGRKPIALDTRADPHPIAVAQAKPVGLILNELVVNALKYAFPDGRAGTVAIDFRCQGAECVLTVRDEGVGIDQAAPPPGHGAGATDGAGVGGADRRGLHERTGRGRRRNRMRRPPAGPLTSRSSRTRPARRHESRGRPSGWPWRER